jgi:GNAT superfamily N-acetyltransferase
VTVRYRAATAGDIEPALDLYAASLADMLRRNGITPPQSDRQELLAPYRHVHATGIFRVAEEDGELVAIAHAIVRGTTWFLSGYWARPFRQRAGVGGPLLREVMDEGRARGAEHFFTWSSIDLTAMAVYMRRGMLPGTQILAFVGEPAEPPSVEDLETAPLTVEIARELDRDVLLVERDVDQRFWSTEPGRSSRAVRRDGRAIGYYSVARGTIGPAAWSVPEYAQRVLSLAMRDARAQSGEVRLRAIGSDHEAIRFALGSGLRLVGYSHLLTTRAFGHLDRYIPSGPTLF